MNEFIRSAVLLLVLLNPFLVIVYLTDVVAKLSVKEFQRVMIRAGYIAGTTFCVFAILGDAVFSDFFQVEFASFQIFGGIVFLLIGLQFVFKGPNSIELLRGESKLIAGAIAMPVLIGPGTISACVVIGQRNDSVTACFIVLSSVIVCVFTIIALKWIHDVVRKRREELVERYFSIAGRITALFVGSVAVDMIVGGIRSWLDKLM